VQLHASILSKDGKPEFAVLPYEEFLEVQSLLEDAEDLRALRSAKSIEAEVPGFSLEEAKRELGL